MNKEEFYKDGNKVLTEDEYNVISSAFDDAEEMCQEIASNMRESITGIMTKLYEKRNSTEFVGKRFTLINRIGDITVIDRRVDSENETSIDDIEEENVLMDIVAEFI